MWVDLGLKCFQLKVFDLASIFHPLFHQRVHAVHHLIEAVHHLSNLIVARRLQPHGDVAFFHSLHRAGKLRYPL